MTDSTAQRPAVRSYWLLYHYSKFYTKTHNFLFGLKKQKGANNMERVLEFYEYRTCFQIQNTNSNFYKLKF